MTQKKAPTSVAAPASLRLYDIAEAGAKGEKDYIDFVDQRLRIYKTIFEKYSRLSNMRQDGFGNMLQNSQTMNLVEIFKFLSDFRLQQGELKSRDQTKVVVKHVNDKMSLQDPGVSKVHELDLVGFIEFMLQLGYHQSDNYTEEPVKFMQSLFDKVRDNSQSLPLLNKFFAQLDKNQEKRVLRELNLQIEKDHTIQIPYGYSKELFTGQPSDNYKLCWEVLGDLLITNFGVDAGEPRNQL